MALVLLEEQLWGGKRRGGRALGRTGVWAVVLLMAGQQDRAGAPRR